MFLIEIEAVVAADVPIASNTSALPITTLQEGRLHPERFLGMHWAEPAYATRFLELIRGQHTSDAAMTKANSLATALGKEPCVVAKDVPGFIVNRLGYAMYREAVNMLESGVADAATIDRAFRNACGIWASLCGPFAGSTSPEALPCMRARCRAYCRHFRRPRKFRPCSPPCETAMIVEY